MIESYSFGRMVVDGQTYTSDLILFPDKIKDSWWRKSGHKVSLEDMAEVFEEEPDVLVIGTGFTGLIRVEEEVKSYTRSKGITLIIKKTKMAAQIFDEYALKQKTIGAFHLTC